MKAQVISFQCTLKNGLGQVISHTYNRDVITQAAHPEQAALPALAQGLADARAGEKRSISLKATEAYGLYDPHLYTQLSLRKLAGTDDVNVGDRVQLRDPHGKLRFYSITKIAGDLVSLDANHPLAGQDLVFDIDVIEARDATQDELGIQESRSMPQFFH